MTRPDLRLTHTLSASQIDELMALYDGVWWAGGRQRGDVDRMLAACLPFGFVDGDGHLRAFARAITDGVYKALVCDVIVAPALRGGGVGPFVVDAVLAHPTVAACGHVELYCLRELVPFYERWGFTKDLGEVTFMRLITRGVGRA